MQTIFSTAKGATITPLSKRWIDDPKKRLNVESRIPLGRAAEAGVFAFLASDNAAIAVDPNTNGAGPFQCLIHLNLAQGREEARDVAALPATNDVLRRFNRDTAWLATGILGVVVCAALLMLAPLIQEGQPKAVDQAKEEWQTGGNFERYVDFGVSPPPEEYIGRWVQNGVHLPGQYLRVTWQNDP